MYEIVLNLGAAKSTIVGRNLLEGKDFEPEVLDLLLFLFKDSKNGLFIDVGSNIGYFPLALGKFFAERGGKLDIFAHEPLPALQRISDQLQRDNSIEYKLESFALSDRSGVEDFFVSSASDSSNSLVKGFRKAKDVIKVGVETLDGMYSNRLQSRSIGPFVLMIDVETAEPAVLRGGAKVIEKYRPLIICEVLAGRTEVEISDILSALGYIYYRFDGTSWVREELLLGDRTYKHRDWLFVPREREVEFGDRFDVERLCVVRAAL